MWLQKKKARSYIVINISIRMYFWLTINLYYIYNANPSIQIYIFKDLFTPGCNSQASKYAIYIIEANVIIVSIKINESVYQLLVGSFLIPTVANRHVWWRVHWFNWIPIHQPTLTKVSTHPLNPFNKVTLIGDGFLGLSHFLQFLPSSVFKNTHNICNQEYSANVVYFKVSSIHVHNYKL